MNTNDEYVMGSELKPGMGFFINTTFDPKKMYFLLSVVPERDGDGISVTAIIVTPTTGKLRIVPLTHVTKTCPTWRRDQML